MLAFERFRAINAYPFREIDLPLRNQGLVRMLGANGSGKSSVWHLFTQSVQGANPNASKKSDMMFTEDNFLLETTFRKNGALYVAAQATKCKALSPGGAPYGTGVYLFRDGQDISKHKDPDTMKLIKQTLGWTLEEWYGYVYLAQATIHTLINGTRSERQQYLSGLFNLSPLDHLHRYFKKKSEDLVAEVEKVETAKQELSIKSQMFDPVLSEKAQADYTESQETLAMLSQKLEKLRKEQVRFETKISLEEKLFTLTPPANPISTLREKLTALETEQGQYTSNLLLRASHMQTLSMLQEVVELPMPAGWKDEYAESPDLDESKERAELRRLTDLKRSLIEVPSVQVPQDFSEVLSSPDIAYLNVKRQIAEIEARPAPPTHAKPTPEQLQALRDKKTETSFSLQTLQNEVKQLKVHGDMCDKCGSHLDSAGRAEKLKAKEDEIQELQDQLVVQDAKIKTAEGQAAKWAAHEALGPDRSGEVSELKASLVLYEKKLQYIDIKLSKEAREQYEQNLKEVEQIPVIEERLRIFGLKKTAKTAVAQKSKREMFLNEKERLDRALQDIDMTKTPDRTKDISAVRVEMDLASRYELIKAELSGYQDAADKNEKIESYTAEISEAQREGGRAKAEMDNYKRIQEDIAKLQETVASQDKVVRDQKRFALLMKGFGKAGGLRERQISKFSGYLEEALLSHTIKQLPHHRFKIQVDDGIDILAEYIGNDKPKKGPYDVKLMSGGEKGSLSVAFLFALDDLLPPGRRTNLKIIDEIEAAFDVTRKSDFIQHTLPELKSRAETVVVISHAEQANSGVFDRVWEIKNGVVKDTTQDEREFA